MINVPTLDLTRRYAARRKQLPLSAETFQPKSIR
jgi:hypothetical protein